MKQRRWSRSRRFLWNAEVRALLTQIDAASVGIRRAELIWLVREAAILLARSR